MTHPSYDEDATVPTTTEVNEVNAAIVAAVAAGESTSAFTTEASAHLGLNSIENLDTSAIESIVTATPGHKRPAEDDADNIKDSVKLRRLQEEVNNNAIAAAGILSSGSSLSNHTSGHSSNHSSNHNSNPSSPGQSVAVDTEITVTSASEQTTSTSVAVSAANAQSTATSTQTHTHTSAQVVVQEALAATAATTHLTATSHSSIMADLERMQQIAKIDPAQLASYSTNPNNQATLEQLTSSALANVLAQAPLAVASLQSNLQLQHEHEQQHEQQKDAVQGILAAASAETENAPGNDTGSSHEDEILNGKRANNRNMTNDERRQRRLLRNRMAAKECRKKKKAYVNELQDTCTRLQEENARLYKEVEELNAKLTLGAMRIDENMRLIKEVEELNAKLTLGVMAGTTAPTHDAAHDAIAAVAQASSKPEDVATEGQAAGSQAQDSQDRQSGVGTSA